ncbi:MAG: DNA recombination protein RmuC, partial [Pseudohongiellaceae bacterium]
QMSLEFKNLANEILEQKGKAFTDVNRQNIHDILKPLGEKIQLFEKKVEDTYNRESKERFSLTREIKTLQELNKRISEDAINLTNALKGESKTQGTWGEVILERVLEKSGLSKGREYEVQASRRTADGGSRQPDVIVHLPEGKDIIIDSKVSLLAYEKYASADAENDRSTFLKQHIQSLRSHIKALAAKDYHSLENVRSLDFVMMFLPVEAAFSLAVQHDSNLFMEAFEKNIILVGPSTLLATLRTIQNIWRYEYQNKNAQEIASRAGALYDKFVGFIDELEVLGKRIDQSQQAYEKAHGRLTGGRGNLVGHVEKLKKLGASTNKQLPEHMLDEDDLERLETDRVADSEADNEEAAG